MARKKPASEKAPIRIQLVRSIIGTTRYQREVVRGLGLRRVNHTVERNDTPEIRGMIDKVSHLIRVTSN
jgi:large subunit ribosomal protein L30